MHRTAHRRPCLIQSLHHHLYHDRLEDAVSTLPLLARRGLRPGPAALALLLRRCLAAGHLYLARRVHLYLHLAGLKRSYPSYTLLSNHLLSFNFLRNRPDDARRLFDRMPTPNLFSYNAMLAGYAQFGRIEPALRLFEQMPSRDVVSWNTMVTALARNNAPREAVELYSILRRSPIGFNPRTFSGLLLACNRLADVQLISQVHAQILVIGFTINVIISSSIMDCYAKCALMGDARKVFDEMSKRDVTAWTTMVYGYARSGDLASAGMMFDEMPERNTVSWNSLIGGYVRSGLSLEALDLFRRMVGEGVLPDQFTFSSILCAVAAIASLKHGKQILSRMLRTHFSPNAIVLSSLIDMYSKCGDLAGGQRVFDCTAIGKRDVVMWNTMISAVGQHGNGRLAIQIFEDMVDVGMKPDANTFVVLLTECSRAGLMSEGVQFFKSMAEKHGIDPEEEHCLCLEDLLSQAGHFEEVTQWLNKMPKSSARAWIALLGACRIQLAEKGDSLRKEQVASWIHIDNILHSFKPLDKLHPSKDQIHAALDQLLTQIGDDSSAA